VKLTTEGFLRVARLQQIFHEGPGADEPPTGYKGKQKRRQGRRRYMARKSRLENQNARQISRARGVY